MKWKGYSMKKIPSDLTTDKVTLTIVITFSKGVIGEIVIPFDELDKDMLDTQLGSYISGLFEESNHMYTPWNEAFDEALQEDIYYGGLQ